MLRSAGLSSFGSVVRRGGAMALVVSAAALAAGCSTDIRRLEQPALGMNETGPRPSEGLRRGVGAPTGSDQTWGESGPRGPLPPVTRAPSDAPPPALAPVPSHPSTAGLSKPFDRPKAPVAATPVGGSRIPSAGTVEVQAGDSLYSIAKRHRVSIAALMEVNQLKSPNLKPGQKLALPATPGARKPSVRAETKVASAGGSLPAVAPVATPVATPAAPPAAAPHTTDWTGTYTVKPGDSLYALSRAHKVSLAELQRVNGITQPTKVRPGTVLKVPSLSGSAPAATEAPRAVAVAAPAAAAPGVGTTTSPRIINAHPAAATPPPVTPVAPPATLEPAVAPAPPAVEKPLEKPSVEKTPAEKAPVVTTAAPSAGAAAANAKFRWPVQGQILASFGKRPDGTQNDGIDIAVPAGTDVAAASAGTVAYAGSELKGYGNLILLRHDNGWVSAYAHASEILVKRGDTVTRGQIIAKSGQTGTVSQPQLHFELRQGSKPVDPAPHLQK